MLSKKGGIQDYLCQKCKSELPTVGMILAPTTVQPCGICGEPAVIKVSKEQTLLKRMIEFPDELATTT